MINDTNFVPYTMFVPLLVVWPACSRMAISLVGTSPVPIRMNCAIMEKLFGGHIFFVTFKTSQFQYFRTRGLSIHLLKNLAMYNHW